jgi:extracellular matrix regulatory protein A
MRNLFFELVHVGSGQFLDANCIVAVASPASFSIRRSIKRAQAKGEMIDMTHGRKTRSAIFLDDGRVFLTSRAPDIIAGRLQMSQIASLGEDDITDNGEQPDIELPGQPE